jgi:hypothetical protein
MKARLQGTMMRLADRVRVADYRRHASRLTRMALEFRRQERPDLAAEALALAAQWDGWADELMLRRAAGNLAAEQAGG